MARGLNKATLIGHLGKDPEMKYTSNGKAVTKFSLATDESYRDNEGKTIERTEWHNIIMWEKLAEISSQYLKKGSKVYLEGRITNRSYEDKEGNKKYISEIIANNMVFLDRKEATTGGDSAEVIPTPTSDAPAAPDEDLPF